MSEPNANAESDHNAVPHRHGWECFKTSGGMLNATDLAVPLSERIEQLYRVAYRTGYRNGWRDRKDGREHEFPRG